MKTFRKICNVLSGICCAASGISCVLMMVIVTIDTTGRFVFSKPMTGAFELCQYLLCIILFGGYAYCQSKHGFLHVTMLLRKMPQKLCCTLWAVGSLFSVVVAGMLAYQCYQQSLYDYSAKAISTLLRIPKYPFEMFACIALIIMVLDLVCDMVYAIVAIFNQKYADEIISEWV